MYKGYFLLILCLVLVVPVAVSASDVGCSNLAATAPSGYGMLNITTSPDGAVVIVDGASSSWLTPTPVSGTLPAGVHTLEIFKYGGYYAVDMSVTVCDQKLTMVYTPLVTSTPTPTPTQTLIYVNHALLTNISVATVATTTTATATIPLTTTTAATVATIPVTTATTAIIASRPGSPTAAPTTASSGSTGALNVSTIPSGATVYLDGAWQGIAPVTISGLAPGAHTLLLELDGYSALTVPVTITAGETQAFTASLSPLAQGEAVAASTTKSPGFAAVVALVALAGAVLAIRRIR